MLDIKVKYFDICTYSLLVYLVNYLFLKYIVLLSKIIVTALLKCKFFTGCRKWRGIEF